jgi:hypothetical protein
MPALALLCERRTAVLYWACSSLAARFADSFNMDATDKFVMWRLAEGDEPQAIVRALKDQDERVEAVLTAYVNGLVQQAEPEQQQHHAFRLTRH